MKYLSLIVGLLLLSSCFQTRPERRYLYSNGSHVKSTVALEAIEAELDSLKRSTYIPPDAVVYTSLRKGENQSIDQTVRGLQQDFRENLKGKNPGIDAFIDSIYSAGDLTRAAIVVKENKSGRILTYYSSPYKWDDVSQPYHAKSVHKNFMCMYAMQREFEPFDRYPEARIVYNNGQTTAIPDTNKYNYHSFRNWFVIAASTIHRGLNERYSSNEFQRFLHGLKIHPKGENGYWNMGSYDISLYDVVSVYATIGNEGIWHKSSLIDSICSSAGKTLYKRKDRHERVLDKATNSEMTYLLKQFALCRLNRLKKALQRKGDTTSFIGNFSNINPMSYGDGYYFIVLKDITIGVRHEINPALIRFRPKGHSISSYNALLIPLTSKVIRRVKD